MNEWEAVCEHAQPPCWFQANYWLYLTTSTSPLWFQVYVDRRRGSLLFWYLPPPPVPLRRQPPPPGGRGAGGGGRNPPGPAAHQLLSLARWTGRHLPPP